MDVREEANRLRTSPRTTAVPRGRPRSFLVVEVLAALGLTLVLVVLFAVATQQYAAARRENDTRRLLRLAAEVELERVRAGLSRAPSGADSRPSTWQPGQIVVTTTTTPGQDIWRGLTRVRVVASKRASARRVIEVELVAYVATGETQP